MNAVLILIVLSVSGGFCESETKQISDAGTENHGTSEDSVFNLMPLKILIEHQLQQRSQEENINKKEDIKRLKTTNLETAEDEEEFGGTCDDIAALKDFSFAEISKLLIGDHKKEEDSSLNRKQLEKIYNSLKNCYFVRVRDNRLWGPLWHCINRLFLFFLVH